jgi:hypothetical protein
MVRELGRTNEVGRLGEEKGLVAIYAYHCYRCNYTWLPRDFDFQWYIGKGEDAKEFGEDLLDREAPKSCARCKSKSWKLLFPLRNKKLYSTRFKDQKWITDEMINGHPWITSVPRMRALQRQGKLTPKSILGY